jgi:anti-sigma regulatory factor (Ser/Thr protein kinase)
MASDGPADGSTGPYRPIEQWQPTLPGPDGMSPVLDVTFDAGTLRALRAKVRVSVLRAGLPEGRAKDVVLAVHELAANSVRHGGGTGRLRVWKLAGSLHCQVDDGDLLGAAEPGASHIGLGSSSGWRPVNSLPFVPGHGLWVVQQVADQVQSLSGPRGTSIMTTFGLPGDVSPQGPK